MTLLRILILWLFFTAYLCAEIVETDYSFRRKGGGGLATIRVDAESGKIIDQKILYQSKHCTAPKKVRPANNGRTILMTNDSVDEPYLFIIERSNPRMSRLVELPKMADEIRVARHQALLTCDKDRLVSVDINSRRIMGIWDAGKILKPKGNGPQDILITKDQRYAIFSFQKDSSKGKKKGGRLALFELPGMILKSDIMLARDFRNWKIENKIRKQGPGLELIFLDERSNTLISTADHYGALAVMNWADVLAGKLKILEYIPTSKDGSWGYAFPDRGAMFQLGKHTYCLITNSGVKGGALLFDVPRRKVVQFYDTPPGLETPVFLPELSKAFAVCPGKRKERVVDMVKKEYFPKRQLFVFDFASGESSNTMKTVDYESFLFQMGLIARPERLPLLAISIGDKESAANKIMIVDPETQTTLDRQPSIGDVVQFSHP